MVEMMQANAGDPILDIDCMRQPYHLMDLQTRK